MINFRRARQFCITRMAKRHNESISRLVLYAIIALTAIVYLSFYLIGYERPYEENPLYNAPLLTGTLIVYIALMLTAATLLVVVSVARRRKTRGAVLQPVAKTATLTAALTVATLVATFVFGSTGNSSVAATPFWSKAADMFLNSALFLIFVAIAAIVANYVVGKKRERK